MNDDFLLKLDDDADLLPTTTADKSLDLFEDFGLEMDLDFGNEETLMNSFCAEPNENFFLETIDSFDNVAEMSCMKAEPSMAEEVEKYKISYNDDVPTTFLLEDVATPLSSGASDSSSSTTQPGTSLEEAALSVTPVVVSQPQRKRQQTTKPKQFACHLCTSTFTARFNLNKHIRTVHENLRPFHCDVCGASFQQKCHLKQHKTTVHEHKRPYKCEICSLSFGWPAVLNKHIRLKHEKQRPFSCTLCDRTFQQKTHLTQHLIALHEKKKPFSCEFCLLTFNRKERLKKHLQTSHNIVDQTAPSTPVQTQQPMVVAAAETFLATNPVANMTTE